MIDHGAPTPTGSIRVLGRSRRAPLRSAPVAAGAALPAAAGEHIDLDELKATIAQQRARILELEALVSVDPLTGVLNRRGLDQALGAAIEHKRRYATKATIGFVDIDNFKTVNDRFGHKVGDEVLVSVAEELRTRLRSTDIVARAGGDEFVLILWHIDGRRAAHRLTAMIADIGHARSWSELGIGLSIGTASIRTRDTAAEALHRADSRMYANKRSKRTTTPKDNLNL